MSVPETETERKGDGTPTLLFFLGAYLLIGAGFTAYVGKWFAGFPVQLDLAYILFGASTIGAYVEAAIAGVLGALCVWAAFAKWNRNAV